MQRTENAPTVGEIHAEYMRRLEQRREERHRYARLNHALGNWRLIVFFGGVLLIWLTFVPRWIPLWLLPFPWIGFIALLFRHERVIEQHRRLTRAVTFYERGVERLEDRWAGHGTHGARFLNPAHPYAIDLDLFGPGSLFERLCLARTAAGEERLADWLQAPADPETIRLRQEAIADLCPRLDLREEMTLLGEQVRSGIDPKTLTAWGEEPVRLPSPALRACAVALAAGNLLAALAWALGYGPLSLLLSLTLTGVLGISQKPLVRKVIHGMEKPIKDLALLSVLLERIEQERFEAPLLRELHAALAVDGKFPSDQIKRLQKLLDYLDYQRNIYFTPIALLLLWTLQCAFAIEAWRAQNGVRLGVWLECIGRFEALSSLAGYAYENPESAFPEFLSGAPCFESEGLGHPLLPAGQVMRNDVRLGGATRLFIVSGSNMSGKSTLLRTIGVNVVLAQAGAPVCARTLRLTPLHLGASIRTQDSLQAGISRFYAEILRLRQIVDIARDDPPLLFLLDEILHGTNSHDRRIGAEAVVRTLVGRDAIGLMTTHDLALARIAEDPALAACNVHFQDHLQEGKMTFDYLLRPGVVERSNAIELMRAVGLEV